MSGKGVHADESDSATSLVSETDSDPNANASIGLDGATCGVLGGYRDIVWGVKSVTAAVFSSCLCMLIATEKAIMSAIFGLDTGVSAIDAGTVANLNWFESVEWSVD